MNCTKCRAPMMAYFKIERVGPDGVVSTSASVCSLTCMLGWGQDYAAHAGIQIAIGVQQKFTAAKNAWDQLKGMFKGPSR